MKAGTHFKIQQEQSTKCAYSRSDCDGYSGHGERMKILELAALVNQTVMGMTLVNDYLALKAHN